MYELKIRMQHLAEARRRTSHWIMREAIAQYVEREEKREALMSMPHGELWQRYVRE